MQENDMNWSNYFYGIFILVPSIYGFASSDVMRARDGENGCAGSEGGLKTGMQ